MLRGQGGGRRGEHRKSHRRHPEDADEAEDEEEEGEGGHEAEDEDEEEDLLLRSAASEDVTGDGLGRGGDGDVSPEVARAVLCDVLRALGQADTSHRLEEARDGAGNDALRLMQLVFPLVAKVYADVLQTHGFPPDRQGCVEFAHCVHSLEKQDPELARLNAEVRSYFLPPISGLATATMATTATSTSDASTITATAAASSAAPPVSPPPASSPHPLQNNKPPSNSTSPTSTTQQQP